MTDQPGSDWESTPWHRRTKEQRQARFREAEAARKAKYAERKAEIREQDATRRQESFDIHRERRAEIREDRDRRLEQIREDGTSRRQAISENYHERKAEIREQDAARREEISRQLDESRAGKAVPQTDLQRQVLKSQKRINLLLGLEIATYVVPVIIGLVVFIALAVLIFIASR
jgi:hypothetical protein